MAAVYRDDSTFSLARWLVPAGVGSFVPGSWYCYRQSFTADAACDSLTLRVACDSKYWLWIDGQLVIREGGLKRGPTPSSTYFDDITLDLALAAGPHNVAVLVWYFGKHGFSHNSSGSPGLLFSLASGVQSLVNSDSTWKCTRHPAFVEGEAPHPNFRLPESNITFDARLDFASDWKTPTFDDSAWPGAVDAGAPGAAPWGALVTRPTPMFRFDAPRSLLSPIHRLSGRPLVSDGTRLQLDLGSNQQVLPYIDIECDQPGATVDLRTDNYEGGGATNLRATYIARAGRQRFECPAWINGHALHVVASRGAVLHDVGVIRTRFDAPWQGEFNCDDVRVNALWKKSCATLDICMRDTYMDCPDRERAQWWGDVVIQMGSAFYACDAERSTTLVRKGIRELVGWQRDDGSLFSPVPTGTPGTDAAPGKGSWDKELPAQMLASIGHFGFWTYYLYTGDRALLEELMPAVRRYLALWRFDEARGLVDHRAGGWDWVDWGANVDTPVSINAWFALALRGHLQACRELGHEHEASQCQRRLAALYDGFNRAFWTGDAYQGDRSLPTHDDRAQAMAVLAGFVDRKKTRAVVRAIESISHAGPYMEKYIVEALFQLGESEAALKRLLHRYAQQIDSPISTLWEGWSVNDATWGGGTYNHAWSGGAITLLQQYVAGIAPVTPAFERFAVRPMLGALRQLKSRVPTKFGLIELSIDVDENELQITVPPGTLAELHRRAATPLMLASGRHEMKWQDDAGLTLAATSEPLSVE